MLRRFRAWLHAGHDLRGPGIITSIPESRRRALIAKFDEFFRFRDTSPRTLLWREPTFPEDPREVRLPFYFCAKCGHAHETLIHCRCLANDGHTMVRVDADLLRFIAQLQPGYDR